MKIHFGVMGIIGICVLLFVAYMLSNNKKAIKWKIVRRGIVLEIIFMFFVLKTPFGIEIFNFMAKCLVKLMGFSYKGIGFVFGSGYLNNKLAFIFLALMPLIFFGALISILYHYGIMQKIIKIFSMCIGNFLDITGVEATALCSTVFVGQSQEMVVICPYIDKLTDSELALIMTGGMAAVSGTLLYTYAALGANLTYVIAGSLMAVPGAIIMSKILFPETEKSNFRGKDCFEHEEDTVNTLDALSKGAMNGWHVVVGVSVMLVAFIALISLLNYLVFKISFGHLTFDHLLEYVFTPVAFIIGVPHVDVSSFATLFGQKTFFNEVIAFSHIKTFHMSAKGFAMACFALTGFANFSSIAIQIGVVGSLAPNKRDRVVKLGLKVFCAALLANLLSAAIVGIIF